MQTTFRANPDVAFPGMLADTMFKRTVSRSVGTTTELVCGIFVSEDVDSLVQDFGTASTVFSGVSQHDHTLVGYQRPDGSVRTSPVWLKTESMSVLQRGCIWVLLATGSTLTNNQPVSALNTAVAQRGFATHGGAAASAVIPNAMTRSKPFTLADGRRIIQVELHAGNAA